MRRILIPLAGFALLNVVGCHLVMGKCDCDAPPVRQVAAPAPVAAAPVAEPLKEMPKAPPNE